MGDNGKPRFAVVDVEKAADGFFKILLIHLDAYGHAFAAAETK